MERKEAGIDPYIGSSELRIVIWCKKTKSGKDRFVRLSVVLVPLKVVCVAIAFHRLQ